jgi:effector-binding domain-containing protein
MEYEFEIKQIEEQPVVAIRAETNPESIGQLMGELFPQVDAYLEEIGVQPAGPGFARYFEYRPDFVDMQAGLPVSEPVTGRDRIKPDELPGGRVAVTWHVGPYDTISHAFNALHEWIHESGREEGSAPWEVYWTHPQVEPDSSKWRTEIYWPIK